MTSAADPALAAIKFALHEPDGEGLAFLRAWLHGAFSEIRRDWPEAPDAVFIGADPLHPGTHALAQHASTTASTDATDQALDLNAASFNRLCEAAAQSQWIPQEHYTVERWVSDCCQFLRNGPREFLDGQRGESTRSIQLNAAQIAAAFEFVAPDYPNDPSQLTDEVVIADLPAGTFSDGSPREAGIYCCLADQPQEGSILLDPTAPEVKLAHCIGCGCDDLHACADRCWWLRVDYDAGIGVCSNCAEHAARWDQGDRPQYRRLRRLPPRLFLTPPQAGHLATRSRSTP